MNKKVGFSSLLITSFLFGTYGFFARELSPSLSASQQISYRYALGFIILLLFILFKNKKHNLSLYIKPHSILFGTNIAFSFLFFILSLLNTKLSVGTSGFYIGILLTSIATEKLIYKEKIDIYGKVGFILILPGFYFLSNMNSLSDLNTGFIYGTISGIMYCVSNFLKKSLTKLEKVDFLLLTSSYSAVIMFIVAILSGESVTPISEKTLLLLLSFVSVTFLAEYLTVVGFRNFNLYLGSIILSLEIFFSGILGYIIYTETLHINELTGIALVIFAVIVSNFKEISKLIKQKYV